MSDFSFIPDGGETGALARVVDWSKTSLGPPERWPAALKTILGMLFHSRHPMFLWWGPDLIQFYNDAYRPSFGNGKHPAAMGQKGAECWPEIWPIIWPQIRDVMEHGKPSWNENQLVPIYRNGKLEDVYWTYGYSPIFDDEGRIGGTLVVCTETTHAVLTAKEVEQARIDAELARQELQGIFMEAPLPMCILTGPEHRFTLVNGRYSELVGRDVTGKPIREAFTPAEVKYFMPVLDEVYASGRPVTAREAPLQLENSRGVAEERYIDVGFHPYRDAARNPKGVLVIFQDVTSQVVARKRLEELAAARQAEVRARDEFLSIASHELRTPLTGLKLQIQSAKRKMNKDDPASFPHARVMRLIDQTDTSLGRMTRLIDDMLDVSRIQAGKLQLQKAPVDFGALVRETLERFAPELQNAYIELTCALPDGAMVPLDRLRMEQVVTNLVTNAIRYAPDAPLRVTIQSGEATVTLRFEDGGPGIPASDQQRIFERFERLAPATHSTGLGIGLFIAQQIVQAHGGSLLVESGPGKGACFVVTLPSPPAGALT